MRPFGTGPMHVIPNRFDVIVEIGIVGFARLRIAMPFILRGLFDGGGIMLTALAFIASALDHMPDVRDDAGLNEALAVLIKIDAPGIARTLGEDLKDMFRGMIPPHRRVDPLSLFFGRARLADERR